MTRGTFCGIFYVLKTESFVFGWNILSLVFWYYRYAPFRTLWRNDWSLFLRMWDLRIQWARKFIISLTEKVAWLRVVIHESTCSCPEILSQFFFLIKIHITFRILANWILFIPRFLQLLHPILPLALICTELTTSTPIIFVFFDHRLLELQLEVFEFREFHEFGFVDRRLNRLNIIFDAWD